MSYAGVTKTVLAKSLENPAKFSEYMKAREKWLRLHNEAKSGWVTKQTFTEELGINDMSGVRVEEEQGNFWMTELYKKHFNQDPPASKLTKLLHDGRKLVGVMLPASAGWQPGVLKITKYSDAQVCRSTIVDTSEDSLRPGQIDDAHRNLLNDMRVEAGTADEGAREFTFKRKSASAVIPVYGDSDDEDNQFMTRFAAKRICGAAGGTGGPSSSSSHPPASGAREERVAKSPSAAMNAPEGKRRKTGVSGDNGHSAMRIRRDAERDAVSLAMLEAEQVLSTASNENAMKMLNQGKIKAAVQKLTKRLQPSCVDVLSCVSDGEEGEDSWGSQGKVATMTNMLRRLNALQALVKAMSMKPSATSTLDLKSAVSCADEAGLPIHSCVHVQVMHAELEQAATEDNWDAFREVLTHGVGSMPAYDKTNKAYENVVTMAVERLLKSGIKAVTEKGSGAAERAALSRLVAGVAAVELQPPSPKFHADIVRLKRVLSAPEGQGSTNLEAVKNDLKAMRNEESPLHSLFVMSAGPLLDMCDAWIARMSRERMLAKKLEKMHEEVVRAEVVDPASSNYDMASIKKKMDVWCKFSSSLEAMMGCVSDGFAKEHNEKVKEIKDRCESQNKAIHFSYCELYSAHMAPAIEGLAKALPAVGPVVKGEQESETDEASAKAPSTDVKCRFGGLRIVNSFVFPEKLGLPMSSSFQKEVSDSIAARKEFRRKLLAMTSLLDAPFDPDSPALHAVIEAVLTENNLEVAEKRVLLTGRDDIENPGFKSLSAACAALMTAIRMRVREVAEQRLGLGGANSFLREVLKSDSPCWDSLTAILKEVSGKSTSSAEQEARTVAVGKTQIASPESLRKLMMLFEQEDGTYQIHMPAICETAVPWILAVDCGALWMAWKQVHKFRELRIVEKLDDINEAVDMAQSAAGDCGKPLDRLLTLAAQSKETRHPVLTLIAKLKAVLNETIKAWANAIATMHKSSLEAGKAVIDAGEVSIGGESGGEGVFRPHVDEGRSRQ